MKHPSKVQHNELNERDKYAIINFRFFLEKKCDKIEQIYYTLKELAEHCDFENRNETSSLQIC